MRSDDDKEIADDDPDFNASDSPPDECESVSLERHKRVSSNAHQIFNNYAASSRNENKSAGSRKSSSKSIGENQDDEAHEMLRLGVPQHKKVDSLDSEDRSAYSSIGQKIENSNQKNDLLVLDYENLSGMSDEQEETK